MLKKITIASNVCALICLLLPFQVSASPARISAMNLDSDTFWMISLDESLFAFNPAILAELRPQVWGQITAPAVTPTFEGGLMVSPAKSVNLYILSGLPMNFAGFGGPPVPALDVTQEQIRLGASLALGGLDLGISAMYTGTSQSNTNTGEKDGNTVFDLGAGAIIIMNPETMNIDVAGDVKIWKLHREITAGVSYDTLTFDVSALGRLNWKMIQNNTFHIYGSFGLFDRSYTLGTAARTKAVTTGINAGFSDEINFSDSIMAFGGGLFRMGIQSSNTDDVTSFSVDAVAGLEVAVIKEALLRVGVMHNFWYMTSAGGISTTTPNGATVPAGPANIFDTTFACGLGVKLGDLLVDVQLNDQILINGPDFISGTATADLSASLAITYFFGPPPGQLK